jgi:protein SCO1/2
MSSRERLLLGLLVGGIGLVGLVVFGVLSNSINVARSAPTPTPAGVGSPIEPPRPLNDFAMLASTGDEIAFRTLTAEHWTLLFFGYTHCPDFCPLTLADFKRVKAALGDDAAAVQFVFVSVDSPRDTPSLLADYLSRFDPAFIGLVGDEVTLAQIKPDFGLFYERQTDTGSAAAYLVDHSTRTYLIDPQMRLRITYPFDTEPEPMAENIRTYLRAG